MEVGSCFSLTTVEDLWMPHETKKIEGKNSNNFQCYLNFREDPSTNKKAVASILRYANHLTLTNFQNFFSLSGHLEGDGESESPNTENKSEAVAKSKMAAIKRRGAKSGKIPTQTNSFSKSILAGANILWYSTPQPTQCENSFRHIP
jgi:hypothetical protein